MDKQCGEMPGAVVCPFKIKGREEDQLNFFHPVAPEIAFNDISLSQSRSN
jgi:hypothetical protein